MAAVLILIGSMALELASASNSIPPPSPVAASLESTLQAAVVRTLAHFAEAGLLSNHLAVTLVDLRDQDQPLTVSYRGEEPIYPASVVKLFYLVAAHQWLAEGRLQDTEELRRALRDMIVASHNEATHYIVDLLTGTTSGPELSDPELERWQHQRDAVNRYFESQGYTGINVNKKPWCEGPYGRETQAIRRFQPNRNLLTTAATARLLTDIALHRAVSAERSQAMLALLKRDPWDPRNTDPDSQARFTGPALPAGSRLWSKAGWTSQTRHDAALIELPAGDRLVLVVFTTGHANNREIIPFVAREVISGLQSAQSRSATP
jgi:beta-lactamase class A